MIQTLQKKFVFTAMTAVTVLLAVLLGAINLANALTQRSQSTRLLEDLAMQEGIAAQMGQSPGVFGDPGLRPRWEEDRSPLRRMFQEPLNEDLRLAALTFTVRLDGEDQVRSVELSRIASVDEEEARSLTAEAVSLGRDYGRIGNLRYQFVETGDGLRSCVFLDVSQQRHAVVRIALLSALGGALAWGAMLVLVWALSRRAIRPIAENMARQRQFVTDAGHELKTPLAIIQANLDAMELCQGENKYSRNIRSQAQRLNDLTRNLLTLARVDEAGAAPALAPVSLSALALEELETFRAPAELRGLQVVSSIQPDVTVQADREQLRQLLSILLDNAVKYSPQGGRLTLELRQEDRAVLRLANTVGPEKVPVDRIFDRFYRADSARNQRSGGFGIGLSAARAIVERHKGQISAAYRGDDVLVFTVKL